MILRRVCIALLAIALAACTRFVVLDPSPDAGSDGHGVPDAEHFSDASITVHDAGPLD